MTDIRIELTKTPKAKPTNESQLGFGKMFTDHMFIMDYKDGAWRDARIVPYGPIELDPSASVFHYGQEVFEGMKAYKGAKGNILLFRPEENFKRLNQSNDRLCIPQIDVDFAIHAVKELVKVDQDWIPSSEGTSLYIRPFIIGCDAQLGVHPASNYKFIIILSPVGAYYASGLNPVKIYVEPSYVRAVRGGIGYAKTGGNYAASLKAQQEATGYSQVLWLDGVERKYIEEVGAMNVFFVIGDEVVTPELQGSILPGITRKSSIELMKSWGLNVVERRLSIFEVEEAAKNGQLKEMFGTGTAAVISPVGELKYKDDIITINNNEIGPISQRLYNEMTAIQLGKTEDPFGWSVVVE
ncbi:branched-chain amino acid aminotransferase [Paludicola sp. MB14-C6]|uniref:branched-chain amino acid aminotransferase n=1 Tax=Paludihabitans sp. MB14-C6 TaxID=3070656 RepID=UPI0027DD1038|nr:branched-chain amino acid aminotransferase [Paludicola sp. MB14-C6]WMJ24371.1 branched-chain amino acid aminotransferase [Paludicola sp. MB14-C6]